MLEHLVWYHFVDRLQEVPPAAVLSKPSSTSWDSRGVRKLSFPFTCIVSYMARPAVTTPPGEFMYMLICSR
jgi:hypothetical protein